MVAYPGTSPQPQDYGFLGWSYDPAIAAVGSNSPANGVAQAITLKVSPGLISNIWLGINSPGVTLVAGQNFAGLYSAGGVALLSSTADQSVAWASGFLAVKIPLLTPVVPAGNLVTVAWFANATTTPKFQWAGSGNLVNANLQNPNARFATGGAGLTAAMPASLALTATPDAYWCAVS